MFRTRSICAFVLFSVGAGFAQSPASLTLTASRLSESAGKSVTFQATGRRPEGAGNRVTFFDRATILGTAPVNGQGQASFSTAWLAAGRHSIYAVSPDGARSRAAEIVIQPVASSSFGAAKHYAAGLTPNAMAIAVFNGDGHLDVALAGASGISVLPGHGDGTFGKPLATPTAFQPTAIAAADFDGDGLMDLVVTDGATGKIYFLRGAGDGTFEAPRVIATGINPVALAIGDFNGDGIADLAVADQASNSVLLLLGAGDGSFRVPVRIEAGVAPDALAVGDFNSDGIADLAVANFGDNEVTILLGKGDGTFSPGASLKVGNGPAALLMSDLNGDGIEDLAVLNRLDATATVFYGKGDGAFQPGVSLPAGSTPIGIAASDPDKNGFRALLVADGNQLRWQQLTTSSARPVVEIDAGAAANGIAVGDFTGDGGSGVVIAGNDGIVWHPRAVGTAFQIVFTGCPSTVAPGQSFSCTVGAYDSDSNPASGFTDTVHFTSSDGSATLPADTTVPTPTTFNFTLETPGAQTVSASDPDNTLTGGTTGGSVTVQTLATHFSVTATTPVNAIALCQITVTALDANNAVVTDYAGTVQFSSSDGRAILPGNSRLISGAGTFPVRFRTAGIQTVTVTDTVTSITGTSNSVTVQPSVPTRIAVTEGDLQSTPVGTAFATALQVSIMDRFHDLLSDVPVTFISPSSGPGATFTGSPAITDDSGLATVIATANHLPGSYSVTASVSGGALEITFSLTNTPGPATHFSLAIGLSSVSAGTQFNVTVTALDQYGNTATGYTGTVQIASSDTRASLPPNSTLTNGVGTFQVTLGTAGSQTVTATDVSTSISGTSGPLTVDAGPPGVIQIGGGTPQSAVVGTAFSTPLQITVSDLYGNPVSGAAVTYTVPQGGASAVIPSAVTNASGIASVTATANLVPGSYTVTPVVEQRFDRKLRPRGGGPSVSFSLTNLANVTVEISPAGFVFSVDGVSYTSVQSFGFAPGSIHTIAVPEPQTGPGGLQYIFSSWSDQGAVSHSILATGRSVTYTTIVGIIYQLTTSASPAAGGRVVPASGPWYTGDIVPLMAIRNPGYRFDHWSGAVAAPLSATTSIVMTGPQTVVATFVLVNGQVSPRTLNLQYDLGAAPSTAVGTLSVTTADGSAFSVTAGDAWLTVSTSSNNTPATVTVTPNVSGMKVGIYYSSLTFSFSDGSVKIVPVTLTILGVSQLVWAATPAGPLNFTVQSGSGDEQSREIIVSATSYDVPLQVTTSTSSPAPRQWLSVSPSGNNNGTTPEAFHVRVDPSGLEAGVYQGTITASSTAAGVTPLNIPVTLTLTAGPQGISVPVIRNAASFGLDSEAPNTIVSAFGVYPGCTSLAQVSVDGSPTTVFYSSPTQVNFLFPAGVSGEASASVQIQCAGLQSPVFKIPVLKLAPAIFTVGQDGTGQAATVNQNGTLATAAPPGSDIEIYGTGFGTLNPPGSDGLRHLALPVTATIGGIPATVLYAGEAPGFTTGLQQINVQIPANAPAGPAVPLQLTVGGVSTPVGVTLAIQ